MTKNFVLITGMHRSGTSFLSRSLNLAGVYLGFIDSMLSNEWQHAKDNLKGHWEHKKLFELGEMTLIKNHGSWYEPPKLITVDSELGAEIKTIIEELYSFPSLCSGYKDPRILLYFDEWKKFFPNNIVIIGIFRHPLKVAESLKNRNGFSYEQSISLWSHYNSKLLKLLQTNVGFLLDFDWPKQRLFNELELIMEKLGLPKINLTDWYADDLLHSDQSYDGNYNLSESVKTIYKNLQLFSEKNRLTQIEKIPQINYEHAFHGAMLQLQNFSNYFTTLYEKNRNEILQLQIINSSLQQEILKLREIITNNEKHMKTLNDDILAIHNSFTWRILRGIDKLRIKLKLKNK